MKKVFLITEHYHATQDTTGYLLGKVYDCFNRQSDYDVTLIAKHDDKAPIYPNGSYIKAPTLDKKSLFKRLKYEIIIAVKYFLRCFKLLSKESIVFSTTTPILLVFILFLLKNVKGFKWILLVHDVFPENLIVANILKNNQLIYKIIKKLFDRVYASADQVIVIGKDMKELVHSKTHKENIHIIQNWIDTNDISVEPRQDNQILKELNWHKGSDVVFQFFGNIGRMQGVQQITEAIKLMKHLDRAKFVFIGNGAYVEALKKDIKDFNHPNVVYYGAINQDQKSVGLNACDVALVTLSEGMLGLGVPSKSYFSMAANKPLLAIMDSRSEVVDMIKQNDIGWSCEAGNIYKLAELFDQIVLNYAKHKLNSPRSILELYYSEPIAMKKILTIVEGLGE